MAHQGVSQVLNCDWPNKNPPSHSGKTSKRQNAIENIFSIARELRNNAATVAQEPQLFQLDKIEANQAPTTVSAEEMAVVS